MTEPSAQDTAREPGDDDFRRWLDDAPDAVVVLDAATETVVAANPRACELYRFERSEFLGMAFNGIVADPEAMAGAGLEIAHYRADGSQLLLEARAASTVFAGRPATLCVLRDVTGRQDVAQRRWAAAEARLEARTRRELLAALSHELRTPLASIVGMADLLLELRLGEPAPEYARLIRSAAERLVEALDDAADFFESEALAPAPAESDPVAQLGPALAREVLERMRKGAAAPPRAAEGGGYSARLERALAEPPAAAETRPSEPEPARILLAEDDPVNRMVALHQLRALGFRVTVVENGREVLAALAEASFDAVLMDCQMPELDGWETTREIRRREQQGERLPIIAVTAHALEGDRERCLEAGMDDYLAKPYREKVLGSVLERWLGGVRKGG